MEALNAVALTPISILPKKRTDPRKTSSICSLKSPLFPTFSINQQSLSRNINGGLAILSSFFSTNLAGALTYEEALQQSTTTASDFEAGGFLDNVSSFIAENPAILACGVAVLAFPLLISQLSGKPKRWGIETAKNAYVKLGDDANAQLLDIREAVDLRKVGGPNIKGLGKKPVQIVYIGEDKLGFLKKLGLKFKEPESTTLFVLDKFDGSSELVAELVTANGFKAAYAIKDGAEGTRGWKNSGLPWIQPKKSFSFDISNFTEAIAGAIGQGSDAVSVAFGVAAVAGLGLFAFTEIETLLEVLGSVAIVQLISKKLLFAEDRKRTLSVVDEFVSTKIAPGDLVTDVKGIGKAFLPTLVISKTLPAPTETEAIPESNSAPTKVEAAVETPPKVEAAMETTPQVNTVPEPEVKAESLPKVSRPLSPFPYYPDYKPPTSPSPSPP